MLARIFDVKRRPFAPGIGHRGVSVGVLLAVVIATVSCRKTPSAPQVVENSAGSADAVRASEAAVPGPQPAAAHAPADVPLTLTERLQPILDLRELPQRREALDDLGAAVAAHDPESAAMLLKKIMSARGQESGEAFAFVSGFIGSYARLNPAAAAAWAAELPLALKFDAYAFVAQQWTRSDIAAASGWANGIEEPSLRMSTQRRMSEAVETTGEPELLAAWAQRLAATPEAEQHIETIARLWGKGDVNGAYEWSVRLPESIERTRAIVAIAGAIAEQDAPAAGIWIERFPPGEARTSAAAVAAAKWAEADPQAAAWWISRLGDAELLEMAVHGVARRWLQRDRPAATAWLQSAPVSEKTKRYLLGR